MPQLFRRFRAPAAPPADPPTRLKLEQLEDRSVPATFTVTNLNDAGAGSLRQAILDANADAAADDIVFQSGLSGDITLTSGRLSIREAVNIHGPGATSLAISGNNSSQIFYIGTNTNAALVTMSGLTLTGGRNGSGGAIQLYNGALTMTDCVISGNTSGNDGGGIYQQNGGDALTLTNCVISGNTATDDGGGLALYGKGGTITNCTISGNTSNDRAGGIEANFDNGNQSLVIRNSTISGNTAGNKGGGIYLYGTTSTSSVVIENSTIAFNNAPNNTGGGIHVTGNANAKLTLRSTIVANNTDQNGANDLFRSTGTVNAENSLIQNLPGGAINGTDTGNITGVDPVLAVLADNGGPTQTHALLSGSPAIDAGSNPSPLNFDQRGTPYARTTGAGTDIGAFEFQQFATSTTLTSSANPSAPGQSVTFTATVTSPTASPLPVTGSVNFFDGTTLVGNATVSNGIATFTTTSLAVGNHTIQAVYVPTSEFVASSSNTLTQAVVAPVPPPSPPVSPPPSPPVSPPLIATGAGSGGQVQVIRGTEVTTIQAFPGFSGGVTVTVGDLTGDGVQDIVTGAGPGGGPHVKVFDGATGSEIMSFFAYDPAFTGGVSVAVGDVTGDGVPDIVTGAGAGGGPHVKVFDGKTGLEAQSFFAYDPAFTGGVSVAVGDVTGDSRGDIITGTLAGTTHVRAFDAITGAVLQSFFAFDPAFTGGVSVAAADLTGDGRAEIVTGAGRGGAPHVKVIDGATGAEVFSFFAYDLGFTGGVSVATRDIDGDGFADILTGAGLAGGPHVKVFNGRSLDLLNSFFAGEPGFRGGVMVG